MTPDDLAPDWRKAWSAVDRAQFIPPVIWATTPDGYRRIDRADEPDVWEAAVDQDQPLVTQLDDGAEDGPGTPTSSASMPSLVARMLDVLSVRDGHRVLEIGTATGYSAALLSERLGDDHVTTIEVDPVLAEAGRLALHAAGYHPTVVTGDGTAGHPPSAPFDRIISTAAVRRVPPAWLEQCRPNGVIVTPWGTAYNNSGLLRLETDWAGGASGWFVDNVAFMWVRGQRRATHGRRLFGDLVRDEHEQQAEHSTTGVHPGEVGAEHPDFAIGLQLPDVDRRVYWGSGDAADEYTVWYLAEDGESWASVDYAPGMTEFPVAQWGRRRLYDEVTAAYRVWIDWGRPWREQFGLAVTPTGRQRVWLSDPDNLVAEV
ncbi:methyltransferase domain-containing protein [Allostreptomyces psammosilenae]|uniref:Protein-L-isoaspartate O-methyltransferase n=1 Tax=Allostreptomyces psammosilenae TaxID=1892865 RepID=A0A853AAL0_9ACTN|nr:methyltransferase domain-containing protein [Allostreptomyces psammosilenae]NYI07661.1 protein-L-isoaspartate(D-aspartate) O-methyltransferase [Allostreptomyces psammosilenae]